MYFVVREGEGFWDWAKLGRAWQRMKVRLQRGTETGQCRGGAGLFAGSAIGTHWLFTDIHVHCCAIATQRQILDSSNQTAGDVILRMRSTSLLRRYAPPHRRVAIYATNYELWWVFEKMQYVAWLLSKVVYTSERAINWNSNERCWLSPILESRQSLSDLAWFWTCEPKSTLPLCYPAVSLTSVCFPFYIPLPT